jgi:transposase
VAAVAGGFSSLADGLSAVSGLALAWNLGTGNQVLAGTGPQGGRTQPHALGGDPRFAVGQDHRKRGRRGYDAGKKIRGRKRHIAVDTEGNVLTAVVPSAGVQDRVGARAVLMRLFCRFDTLVKVFVDGGYTGSLIEWAKQMFGYDIEVVKRNEQHLFRVLPKRWIVERTLAWLNWSRRLSKAKDYELLHTSAETMIYVAFAHLLLRRLA